MGVYFCFPYFEKLPMKHRRRLNWAQGLGCTVFGLGAVPRESNVVYVGILGRGGSYT